MKMNLETANVMILAENIHVEIQGFLIRVSRAVHDAEIHQRLHLVRLQRAQIPRHHRSPIMPHNENLEIDAKNL